MGKFNFLGINFDNFSVAEAIEKIEEYIEAKNPRMVFTPNAELIVRASKDKELQQVYNNADLVTIDSWVVYYFAKLKGHKLKEPASAANIMFKFLPIIAEKGYSVFLLGASQEVVEIVNHKLKEMGINIVGYNDGYFDKKKPEDLVNKIKKSKADLLFVAMSTPFKEDFVSKNLKEMNVSVSIGVGGSFDIIAGKCKHAPLWISRLGLEWFYRFIQEPNRLWKRYLLTNLKFFCIFFLFFLKK